MYSAYSVSIEALAERRRGAWEEEGEVRGEICEETNWREE